MRPILHRPTPESPRARRVVEWADVAFYIFLLAYTAVSLVVFAIESGPLILSALK